ncbi:nucleoside phosphatase family-domain-containing protein [Pavlovales sp. CCMP2436]|nr:nucleoside phosphatase family-domain-containing protein [Pavlovales sp. CCMP2436]
MTGRPARTLRTLLVACVLLALLGEAAAKKASPSPATNPSPATHPSPATPPPSPSEPTPKPEPFVDWSAEPGDHPLVATGPHPQSMADAEFGLLIDAGSTGSRLHVYEWPKRIFTTLPPPISHPLTSELWTKRRGPGISSFVDDPKAAAATLIPLIEHAKMLLRHYKMDWHRFPIWVKATAGMRALPHAPRRAIVEEMRALLLTPANPFYFVEADSARVISGEEEAAYAWTGINFALGHLLDDGTGAGTARPTQAVGIIEMGGASSQLSFINPGHDVIENLFKVQVGGLKHWNIYAHSFLHYGAYSAMQRMWNELAEQQGCFGPEQSNSTPCVIYDACLPAGSAPLPMPPTVTNDSGVAPPGAYSPLKQAVLMPAPEVNGMHRYERCFEQLVRDGSSLGLQGNRSVGYTEGATRRKYNEWCDWAHHGQCAMTDVYLPLLPDASDMFGDFHLLGSSLVETFQAFGVPQAEMRAAAEKADEAAARLDSDAKRARQICFKAALATAILNNGFGVHMDRTLFATDVIETKSGSKLKAGWALGAILFEINSLPWTYRPVVSTEGVAKQDITQALEPTPQPADVADATNIAAKNHARSPVGVSQEEGKLHLGHAQVAMLGAVLAVVGAFVLALAAVVSGVSRLKGPPASPTGSQAESLLTEDEVAESGHAASSGPNALSAEQEASRTAARAVYAHLLPAGRRRAPALIVP